MRRERAPGLRPPIQPRVVNDPELDRVVRDHARCIVELQQLALAGARVIAGVALPDATDTPVAHRLGRPPVLVLPGAPRGAGLTDGAIHEVPSSSQDRRDIVVLRATGYGATITVDILVL